MRTKGLYKRCAAQIRKISRLEIQFGHRDLKRGQNHKDTRITGLTDKQKSGTANSHCKHINKKHPKTDTSKKSLLNLLSVN